MLKPILLGKTLAAWSNRYLILIIVAGSFLGLLRFNTIQTGSFYDDAHYIVLAQSIASGSGYRLINYPTAPIESAFPPGWALLLAPFVGLSPANFALMKGLSFAFWLLSLLVAINLLAKRLPGWLHPGYAALVTLNPLLIGISGTVMSESAYLFFSLASLSFASDQSKQPSKWRVFFAFALAICAATIRTIGITLVVALLLHWLIGQRGSKRSILGALIVLVVSAFALLLLQQSDFRLLSAEYRDHIFYVGSEFVRYLRFWEVSSSISLPTVTGTVVPFFNLSIIRTFLTPMGSIIGSACLLLMILWGMILEVRKRNLTEIYVLLFVGILYFWFTYIQQTQSRQLIPIVPFLTIYLLQGVDWFVNRFSNFRAQTYAIVQRVVVVGLTLYLFVMVSLSLYEWRYPLKESTVDLTISGAWLAANTPVDATIMAIDALPVYIYAKRKTVDFPVESADIKNYLTENNVKFILIQPNINPLDRTRDLQELFWYTQGILLPYLDAQPTHFRKVYSDEQRNVSIYEVLTLENLEATTKSKSP